jgi:hypothetical protein
MSSYQKKSDWGCLGWFLLAFAVLCLVILAIVLATTPSGGGAGPCQSLSNNDRLGKGNSTAPVKWSRAAVTVVPVGSSPRPVKPAPAVKPVLPNNGQPKTQKPPQGGSGGSHKPSKHKLDLDDCD